MEIFTYNIQDSRNTHMHIHNTYIFSQHEDLQNNLPTRRKENSMDHGTNLSPSNGNVSCSRAPSPFLQTLKVSKNR